MMEIKKTHFLKKTKKQKKQKQKQKSIFLLSKTFIILK